MQSATNDKNYFVNSSTVIALVYLALHFSRQSLLIHVAKLKVTPADISCLFVYGLTLWGVYTHRIGQTDLRNFSAVFVSFLTPIFLGLAIALVNSHLRWNVATLLLIFLRDIFFALCIGLWTSKVKLLHETEKSIMRVTLLVIAASGPLFLYRIYKGEMPRFMGFCDDPNFFSWFLVLPVMICVMRIARKDQIFFSLFSLIVLLLSIFYGKSRSILPILVVIAICHWSIIWIYARGGELKKLCAPLLVTFIGFPLLLVLCSTVFKDSFIRFMNRFESVDRTPRFSLWITLFEDARSHLWFGGGLRRSQEVLSGTYAHNSFLDILVEQGLLGLMCWLISFGMILYRSIKIARKDPCIIPWIYVFVSGLFLMFVFSIQYNLFLWLGIGVIIGRIAQEKADAVFLKSVSVHNHS